MSKPMLNFSRSRLWSELTTEDFGGRDMAATVAVLPLAAIEQHGPHLPTGTDALIMEGHLARVRGLLEDAKADVPPIVILPTQEIGLSTEHVSFAGTLTLSPETAIRAWRELGYGIVRAGCRKLVMVSSHGGNSPVIDIVSRALRLEAGLVVAVTSWSRLGYPDGLFDADEVRHGIHGGEIETSLMLAFRPDLVRRNQARDFVPTTRAMEQDYEVLRADRPAGFAWLAQDLQASGAMGNAAAATAEKGVAAADHAAARFVRLLADVGRFDLGDAAGRSRPGFI